MDQYEAPTLPDEDIGNALRTGLLGEQIAHVTIEQLKSASSALVLQLCVSILQKLDVDTDNLGQMFLQPQLDHPEHYQNATLFALHVPRFFHHLIPGCTLKRICTADILRPKWNKLRKFLSVVINYCRFVETNMDTFREINAKSEELHKNVEEMEGQNSNIRAVIREVDEYMVKNSDLFQEQKYEKAKAEKELEDVLSKKEVEHNFKEDSKKSLEKANDLFNDCVLKHNSVREKIDDIKKLVVTSPEKQVSELNELNEKLKGINDDVEKVQDDIQKQQWSIEKQEEIIERIDHAMKQLAKYMEFYDKFRTIKTGLMKEQFQIDEFRMSLACIRQEIDSFKQLKVDERDQIHRSKLRGEKVVENQKQHLQELNRQTELLLSRAQDKGQQISSLLSSIQEEKLDQNKENEHHTGEMSQLDALQAELTNAVEQTYTNANAHIRELVRVRSASIKSYLNSNC